MDDIQGLQGLMEVLQGKVGNKTVSPDRLQGHRIRKGTDAQIGQSIEGGSLVVWIRASLEKAILFHFVELFLRPRVRQLNLQLIDIVGDDFKTLHYNSVSC